MCSSVLKVPDFVGAEQSHPPSLHAQYTQGSSGCVKSSVWLVSHRAQTGFQVNFFPDMYEALVYSPPCKKRKKKS
ncbi:rCG42141 [Rattus norvegicus]|uniref:RCG42141 n=2 Tax=Rattus norvegicus TaxID=10116 RepID=A6K031_RAT|nr:rCG42141 [Rattus norvegicus]